MDSEEEKEEYLDSDLPLESSTTGGEVDQKSLDSYSDDSNEYSSQKQSSSDKPDSGETGLSKKQLKKLRKSQRWEEHKLQKRALERQRKKERRKLAREQGMEVPPSRKALKRITMAGSSCKVKVVVDCSFDDLMNDKDICNIVRQLGHCYGVNRRIQNPLQFYVSSVEKKTLARLEALKEYKHWDVNFHADSYDALFKKEDIVYLSSDSPNVLETLNEDKVYIIGGLVDHNHHKGLCLKLAEEKGVAHAKLPITDYVKFNTRKVLTINQVFEILVAYTEKADWENAFFKVIPKRKAPTVVSTDEKKLKTEEDSAVGDKNSPANNNCELTEEESVKCSLNKEDLSKRTSVEAVSDSLSDQSTLNKVSLCSTSNGNQHNISSPDDCHNVGKMCSDISDREHDCSGLYNQLQSSDR